MGKTQAETSGAKKAWLWGQRFKSRTQLVLRSGSFTEQKALRKFRVKGVGRKREEQDVR